MGSFYIYAFSGLGTMQVPQSFEVVSEKDSPVVFDFKTTTPVDKMCYYVGIDKNVNFVLEYQKQGRWQKFYTYANSYPYSFRWRCMNTGIYTSKVLLRVTKNKMMLNEVRFLSHDKVIPYTSRFPKLNDETSMKLDTSYYGGMYFDEIYHGRTAYEIMHGLRVYENTHPYLGKLLITPGIKLFGMTPFGWRMSNVVFAGLMIFIFYYFALLLFKDTLYAWGAGFLMTYGFMHIAQARMAHIDTFTVLFVLLSYMFLYRFITQQKIIELFASGLFFGLASAVKWSAIFSGLGFVLLLLYVIFSRHVLLKRFTLSKLLLYGLYSYVLIAGLVYLLTFPEMYQRSGGFDTVINYNLNMYHYHSTMTQTHPYSSQWWSWPLDMKPMGYYKHYDGKLLSTINAFGNPAVFWLGIMAVLYLIFVLFKKATLEAALILSAFAGVYLPYVFVGRLMFIYHFYYAVPFLMLVIIYMFKDLIARSRYGYGLFVTYLLIVAGLF
ncbi:MAG: glycosyltransferase family 39 protein [Epsilonproteobacteria bacterium]|nr:glycosyltransferase family 39 protein [Campylobacterota bacterium]